MTSISKERERSVAYAGKKFSVERSVLEHTNGRSSVCEVVRHPGAVVILPLTKDGQIVAIRQYRHALSTSILELPAGTLEAGESPRACASREIIEEVGYRAGTMLDLGVLYPAPGFCDEKQYLFLATDLSPASAPADDDEVIEVVPMSLEAVREAIKSGELSDAKSIAAFYRADLRGLLPSPRSSSGSLAG